MKIHQFAMSYLKITSTVEKVFCDHCNRRVKPKQHQLPCSICKSLVHKICTSLTNAQYHSIINQSIPYMCLKCQANTFPFSKQTNNDISLINSGLNSFEFSGDTVLFPDEKLKSFLSECNSIETPFNDAEHQVLLDSKYHDINDFNRIKISKQASLATLHLNIASISKHFEDLQNLLSVLKHSFDIIGISEHKINKTSKKSDFHLPGYTFCFTPTESSHGGTGFFISNDLTFKLRPDLQIDEPGRLESTFIEIIFPNKRTYSVVVFTNIQK